MKKTSMVLCLSVLYSAAVFAQQDTSNARVEKLEGAYLGADISFANKAKMSGASGASKDNGDATFNLNAGYDFAINNNFVVGLEGEYRQLGEFKFYNNIVDAEGAGFSLNIKPKYYINETTAYFGAILGAGMYDLDYENSALNKKDSERETGFQFGLEFGYEFENIVLSSSIRRIKFDDVSAIDGKYDAKYTGFTIGAKYKF